MEDLIKLLFVSLFVVFITGATIFESNRVDANVKSMIEKNLELRNN